MNCTNSEFFNAEVNQISKPLYSIFFSPQFVIFGEKQSYYEKKSTELIVSSEVASFLILPAPRCNWTFYTTKWTTKPSGLVCKLKITKSGKKGMGLIFLIVYWYGVIRQTIMGEQKIMWLSGSIIRIECIWGMFHGSILLQLCVRSHLNKTK